MSEGTAGSATPRRGEISVQLSADEGLIAVKLSGGPDADSIVRMLGDLDTMIEQGPSLRVLIDETELRPSIFSPADIGRFVSTWRRSKALRSTRIGVFVSNLAMYGLNRMFQGLANAEDRVGVFHDRAHAVAWLNEGREAPTDR